MVSVVCARSSVSTSHEAPQLVFIVVPVYGQFVARDAVHSAAVSKVGSAGDIVEPGALVPAHDDRHRALDLVRAAASANQCYGGTFVVWFFGSTFHAYPPASAMKSLIGRAVCTAAPKADLCWRLSNFTRSTQ